ncbi:unnamed protein product [Effrenium voratum]|nr:unnamed protein product [Effrenium voratum]
MADLRLEIRTLSGGLLLEAKLPHGATGAQLHELVNATATLATEWRLVHRGSELELQQPLAAEDGETIFAAAKPHATEDHAVGCEVYALPKGYQVLAPALPPGKYSGIAKRSAEEPKLVCEVIFNKYPNTSLENARRVFQECQFLSSFENDHLLKVCDIYMTPPSDEGYGDLYTLRPVMNTTVAHVLRNIPQVCRGSWDWREYIFMCAARGLVFLHSANVAHGDVCPENIWLNSNDEVQFANLRYMHPADTADFDPFLLEGSDPLKSLRSTAPEVLRRETSGGAAGDLWGLGCLLGDFIFPQTPAGQPAEYLERKVPASCEAQGCWLRRLLAEAPAERGQAAEVLHAEWLRALHCDHDLARRKYSWPDITTWTPAQLGHAMRTWRAARF